MRFKKSKALQINNLQGFFFPKTGSLTETAEVPRVDYYFPSTVNRPPSPKQIACTYFFRAFCGVPCRVRLWF